MPASSFSRSTESHNQDKGEQPKEPARTFSISQMLNHFEIPLRDK
jgi:hypothetical protein